MKALIITEDDSIINAVSPVIKNCGYEIIVYRYLLKALDNVEEIAPDLVFISTAEYPRHWKTFIQFTKSGISGIIPKVLLYNSRPLSNDEKDKARALCVFGMISSVEEDGLSELKKYLNAKGMSAIEESGPKIEFIFKNPRNGRLVTGSVKAFNGKKIEFVPDISASAENLKAGDIIERAVLGKNKIYKTVSATLLLNGKAIELKLS